MSTDKTPRLGIRVTDELKANFERIAKAEGLNHAATLEKLIAAYDELQLIKNQRSEIELTEEEGALVSEAIEASGMDYKTLAKRGLLAEARTQKTQAAKRASLSELDDSELVKTTYKGAAFERINRAVERVMQHNDNSPEKKNKFCVSESLIFKLTGSNRQAIRDYFDQYHLLIDDHNQKHSLTDTDNRKGKGYDFKAVLGL